MKCALRLWYPTPKGENYLNKPYLTERLRPNQKRTKHVTSNWLRASRLYKLITRSQLPMSLMCWLRNSHRFNTCIISFLSDLSPPTTFKKKKKIVPIVVSGNHFVSRNTSKRTDCIYIFKVRTKRAAFSSNLRYPNSQNKTHTGRHFFNKVQIKWSIYNYDVIFVSNKWGNVCVCKSVSVSSGLSWASSEYLIKMSNLALLYAFMVLQCATWAVLADPGLSITLFCHTDLISHGSIWQKF